MTTATVRPVIPAISSPQFLPGLVLLFIGSGCAALIYEVIWLQLLSLVIGSNATSLGVLLGTFMGGMCLGSLVLPQLIPVRLHPLRVYAVLEILIGIVGIAIVYAVPYLGDKYATMPQAQGGLLLRVAIAAACLLPPTILMGATLPAIARWVETTPQGVSWMGFFYGGNIAGAVIGCLSAGFYLLPEFDMPTATYIAAGINGLVAVAAILLSGATDYRPPSPQPDLARATRSPSAGRVYIAIALSGLTALGAEVIWVRLLSLMLGATVYTFSIILAVFLFGLGIGSSIGAMVAREAKNPRLALGVCQFLVICSIGWAAFAISRSLPFWPIDPSHAYNKPGWIFQVDLMRAMWAVLPGAVVWGASFPIALAGASARGQDPGKLVGRVYAANTVGAILGAVLFSIVIIPQFGTVGAQRIAMGIAAVSCILLFLPGREDGAEIIEGDEEEVVSSAPPGIGLAIWLALVLVVVAGLMFSVKPVPWQVVAWGRWVATEYSSTYPNPALPVSVSNPAPRTANGTITEEEMENLPPGAGDRVGLYVGEGTNVSVAVTKSRGTGWQYFHGAGKVQASSDPQDMRLQRLLGHISVLAHPRPDEVRDVLVVACGAGVTAGSFIPYPKIQSIRIVDIEKLVPTQVTPMFTKENYGIVDNIKNENPTVVDGKSVNVIYDDGRHYVRTMKEQYDIITSDPIDPWVKGCAALNTVEYYQMCKDHLKPGGVMSLWIPLYESNEDTAKSVIATFFKVFPNGIIWSNDQRGEGYDAVLFGIKEDAPVKIDVDAIAALLNRQEYLDVRQSLRDVGFGADGLTALNDAGAAVATDMFATYAGQATDMQKWTAEAERDDLINWDRNLRLQYVAGLWFNTYMSREILNKILEYYRFPTEVFSGSEPNLTAMRQVLRETGRRDRLPQSAPPARSAAPETGPVTAPTGQ